MYHENRGRHSAHHTLLSNMHHDNRGRHIAYHTLMSNMYHDNRGRHSAHHTLLPNMYNHKRVRHSAHHTLLPNMYNHNRGRHSASSEFANYLTCTTVTAKVLYLRTSSSLFQKIIQFMINVLDWQKTRGILKM